MIFLRFQTRGSNRRGIHTRDGSNSSGQKTDDSKTHKEQYLEMKWKHEDHQPDIFPFTNQPKFTLSLQTTVFGGFLGYFAFTHFLATFCFFRGKDQIH